MADAEDINAGAKKRTLSEEAEDESRRSKKVEVFFGGAAGCLRLVACGRLFLGSPNMPLLEVGNSVDSVMRMPAFRTKYCQAVDRPDKFNPFRLICFGDRLVCNIKFVRNGAHLLFPSWHCFPNKVARQRRPTHTSIYEHFIIIIINEKNVSRSRVLLSAGIRSSTTFS
jgi:hypothetical protein